MVDSLSMQFVLDYSDLRSNMYKVEEHLREVDPMKDDKISDDTKKREKRLH